MKTVLYSQVKMFEAIVLMILINTPFLKGNFMGLDFDVIVDLKSTTGELQRMWDNTGLSPPGPGEEAVKYLTSKEQQINIALIGSLPFKAISHIRIHWLLDLISSTVIGSEVKFDYRLMDQLIQWVREHRMKPGFELMGNPGGLFNDLNSNSETLSLWQRFVTDLAAHYIELYGKEEVQKWRFELWNEVDSHQYNILNLTTSGYLKYAAASIQALKVHGIKVSGPAGTFKDFKHHNLSWSLLETCNSMIIATGKCDLETITFHKKGGGVPDQVVSSTAEFFSLSTKLYPKLKTLQFANNEADILSGWWREEKWRGDVNYAADVCQVLSSFLSLDFKQRNMSLMYISNDNGFINQPPAYFDQRTLLTRFQMNTSQDRHSQFIRKPVMVAMALLSYLGPKEMPVYVKNLTYSPNCSSRLSVLAAGDGLDVGPDWTAAVMISLSACSVDCPKKYLQLTLKLPLNAELTYVIYMLDNELTNPRTIWEQAWKPKYPDANLRSWMRKHEGPHVFDTGTGKGIWLIMALPLECPSVYLLHLCFKPHKPPGKVLGLHAVNITYNEVLLLWQDADTRCVKTYEVYFSPIDSEEFQLVSDYPIIMLAFQFRASSFGSLESTRGSYKVRIRDYWDRLGTFSDMINY